MAEIDDVKYQVALANRVLAEVGLATGMTATLGHASMRVPGQPDKFVVKGRGYRIDALAMMQPEDMVVVDLEGYKVDGPPGVSQCFEVKMHSCLYRERPEVQSVVHVHPRYTVVMSVLGAQLVPMCQEGSAMVRTPLPVYPHIKTIVTDEEGMEVVKAMGNSKAILLQGHGATTVGESLNESVINMFGLEEQAKMNYLAYAAAGPNHPSVPVEWLDEWRNQTHASQLAHFRPEPGAKPPRVEGVWMYYLDKVTREFERERR